jgi:predicted RNA binding protein YcfA (HicA-like mRNA interferase family)
MGLTSNKDVNVLIKEAQSQGWNVAPTKNSHLKWLSPKGGLFFSSSTPSDRMAIHRIKQDLRMNGFVEIKKKTRKKR